MALTLEKKAKDMRNAIDAIETAMMGLGDGCGLDFIKLRETFEGSRDDLQIVSKMTVGQMNRVCEALDECTRIINSPEYTLR